jgi:four helix bundle protein
VSAEIKSYQDLAAWQAAYALALSVYKATSHFPADERYGLTSQLRRASVSVSSNIAEGYGRGRRTEYARYLRVARGSLFEVENQAMLSRDLGYLQAELYEELKLLIDGAARPLSGLIRSIEGRS